MSNFLTQPSRRRQYRRRQYRRRRNRRQCDRNLLPSMIQSSQILKSDLSMYQPAYYDFGKWGYFTSDTANQILPGFVPEPPRDEVLGKYDILFAAALEYHPNIRESYFYLRRTVAGDVILKRATVPFTIKMLQGTGNQRQITHNQTHYSGRINVDNDPFFGGGYNIFGFSSDAEVSQKYQFKPSNAATIVTKLNNNLGRLYVVSERKAFPLIKEERGLMTRGDTSTEQIERIYAHYSRDHPQFSFLTEDLNFPCCIASYICQYLIHPAPFLFVKPGDLWIDIRLSTPKRTYILARKRKDSQ